MTDQAPELLPCPFCGEKPHRFDGTQYYSIGCDTPECVASPSVDINKEGSTDFRSVAVTQWNTRPPSERPVAQVREALELAERIKVLPAYTGRELDARLYRVDLGDKTATDDKSVILIGVEHRDLLVRALTAERPEAAVAWLCEYDGHTDATTSRDTMCLWKDTLGRKITPLYAIQHEEPGRETMTSVPKPDYLLRGGPGFDYPCANPNIIECADHRCQEQQRCRKSPTHSPPHRGI